MFQSTPEFPDIVRRVRAEMHLSQEDLARELGVSFSTVNRWENRKTVASRLARTQFEGFCNRMIKQGKLSREAMES